MRVTRSMECVLESTGVQVRAVDGRRARWSDG